MPFVTQDLTAKDLSQYRPGRNSVYAVTKYFSNNRSKIEQKIAEADTRINYEGLFERTIVKFARDKEKKIEASRIAEFIDSTLKDNKRSVLKPLRDAQKARPGIAERLKNLALAPDSFERFSRNYKSSHEDMAQELRLFEHEIADPNFTRVVHKDLDQEKWNKLRAKEREAGTLELLGFTRDQSASLMGINNRVLTNYISLFKKRMGIDDSTLREMQSDIRRSNITEAHSYQQKVIDFLYDIDELKDPEHYTQKYDDLELIYIASQFLRRNPHAESSGKMARFKIAGLSYDDIEKETGIGAVTVNRNIKSIRKQIREKLELYDKNPAPDGINPFDWVSLSNSQRKITTSFITGKSIPEIAKSLRIKTQKAGDHLRASFQKLNVTREYLLDMHIKAKVAQTSKPQKRKKLLKKLYGANSPEPINGVIKPNQLANRIYDSAYRTLNAESDDSKRIYELGLQGLDSAQIFGLGEIQRDSSSTVNVEIRRLSTKITKAVRDDVLKPLLDEAIGIKAISNKDQEAILHNNLFPPGTQYSLGCLKLEDKPKEELFGLIRNMITELENDKFISIYLKAYINGFNTTQIAKHFAVPKESIIDALENDFKQIRRQITIAYNYELPDFIPREKFSLLPIQERIVIAETIAGRSLSFILSEYSHNYGDNSVNVRSALERAAIKLGLEKEDLDKLRLDTASAKYDDYDFVKANLLKRIFPEGLTLPDNVSMTKSAFEDLIQRALWEEVNNTESEILSEWKMYLAGVDSPAIAERRQFEKKPLQSNLATLKRGLRRKIERFITGLAEQRV